MKENHVSRRKFMTTMGLGIASMSLISKCQNTYTGKRPNILFAIADDMSWVHAGIMGCKEVNTPHFDWLAENGVLFENAYCSAPSCAPSRASVLTGRNGWELEQGAVLWGYLPSKYRTYPDILEENGYHVGYTGKGWGPGDLKDAGRERNPAGIEYNQIRNRPWREFGNATEIWDVDYAENFKVFLKENKDHKPFCFWVGALEPHRWYAEGIGKRMGKNPDNVKVPEFLPDTPEVRSDILDYLAEIDWYDIQMGRILDVLREKGELENTLVVMTSDNGMPFPRAKANLYEYGTHMPLAVYWGDQMKGGRKVKDFISFKDFAPTFLEAAGVPVPQNMSGKSFIPQLLSDKSGQIDSKRNVVHTYKERHAWSYPQGDICPMRSIRKENMLLIWNARPEMWPAGHELPEYNWDMMPFGDVDEGPSYLNVLSMKYDVSNQKYYNLAFGKRPEFELYDVIEDPYQLNNLADKEAYQATLSHLKKELTSYLKETGDLRMFGKASVYQNTPYYCTKGLESGGLWLKEWQALNLKEKDAARDRARQWIMDKLERVRKLQQK